MTHSNKHNTNLNKANNGNIGKFDNLEEAVKFKHEELKKALNGFDLNKLIKK